MDGFLGEEGHVFVNGVVGDVLVGGVVEGDEDVEEDDHDDEGEDVVEDDAEGRGEVLKSVEVGGLHDGLEHGLHDEVCDAGVVVDLVHADEGLEEADHDDDEEGEEDEGFGHHDFEDDEHGAEEAEGVEVEEQAHPEHGGGEGEKVVGEDVEAAAGDVVDGVAERDHAGHEADGQEGVEDIVEGVPEGEVVTAYFPKFGDFVEDEAGGHEVEDAFNYVQVAGAVDCVYGACV